MDGRRGGKKEKERPEPSVRMLVGIVKRDER